ncbi:pyrroloquinoline quinone biosynthesis protein PqqB [Kitasatospora sp. NPDC048407]|uniref:pyrroloquinoline quinone biosynthesis protein PqqB n=1 Tax=Kitasatospora sp. NPDC048407 TaxID=3364051 RepID=UPI0037137D60
MRLRVLGTAAGGGLPQWNCACPTCARARAAGPEAWRTQECLAVSASDDAWYLVNASPDLRVQLLAAPELAPPDGTRGTPLRGVLLTDGELDHTAGLLALREGAELDIHAPPPVWHSLGEVFPLRGLLARYGTSRWHPLDRQLRLGGSEDGGLTVAAFPVSDKRPRYAAHVDAPGPWAVAYRFTDTRTGACAVYAPSLADWPDGFDAFLAGADCLLLDGTFWSDEELQHVAGERRTARAFGHLPIAGPDGTLRRLRPHPGARRLYTHLNNTNPLTDPDSDQHKELAAEGVEVAADGLELRL